MLPFLPFYINLGAFSYILLIIISSIFGGGLFLKYNTCPFLYPHLPHMICDQALYFVHLIKSNVRFIFHWCTLHLKSPLRGDLNYSWCSFAKRIIAQGFIIRFECSTLDSYSKVCYKKYFYALKTAKILVLCLKSHHFLNAWPFNVT